MNAYSRDQFQLKLETAGKALSVFSSRREYFNLPLPPHRLPPHPRPLCHPQIRQELRQIAFIFGFSNESADRVDLMSPAASPSQIYIPDFAPCHPDQARPFTEGSKIDV
jgi:hypothetical protein